VGGGKAHGPKGVKRALSLPKKMRQKALKIALSMKAGEKRLVVIDGVGSLKKTKETSSFMDKVTKSEKEIGNKSRFTFLLSEKNKGAEKFIRNIENARVSLFKDLNAYKVYFGGALVVDKSAFEEIKKEDKKKLTKTTEKKA
jgi:large subunit ribosomal protein L4